MAKAIDTFHNTITRSKGLLTIYEKTYDNEDFVGYNTADLLRAALVLTVAGMDAFFTARFTENLIAFIKNKGASKDLIDILEKAGLNTEQALYMSTMDRPHRRIRSLVDQYLSDYTTQRFEVIDRLFLVYGIKNLTDNAQGKTGRIKLKRSIQRTVERRHKIAHAGDYNSHNKLSKIEFDTTKRRIDDIKLFVDKCEELIDKILNK